MEIMESTAIRWMDRLPEPRPQLRADGALAGSSPPDEAALLGTRDLLVALPQLGLLAAQGGDAEGFLQGQVSCDLRQLTTSRALFGGLSSPKGRLLATMVLRRTDESVWLEAPAELTENIRKRLSMYVLRADVRLRDASAEYPAIGLIGDRVGPLLEAAGLPVPESPLAAAQAHGVRVLRHPGQPLRVSLRAESARLPELWQRLARDARPVGPTVWTLAGILAGVPTIREATQDHFVAQMVNLDRLGGISYDKGCYTGQEVIARLHYRGNLKRRMFLARAPAPAAEPGCPVFDADGNPQPVGEVVDAAAAGAGDFALLVVLQLAHLDAPKLRLGAADGVPLQLVGGAPDRGLSTDDDGRRA